MSRGGPPPVIERDDGRVIDLTTAIGRHRRIDTAFEIYLGLYQAVTGPEERQKLFREFSPGFFESRQRRRGFGLARNPGILLRTCHPPTTRFLCQRCSDRPHSKHNNRQSQGTFFHNHPGSPTSAHRRICNPFLEDNALEPVSKRVVDAFRITRSPRRHGRAVMGQCRDEAPWRS